MEVSIAKQSVRDCRGSPDSDVVLKRLLRKSSCFLFLCARRTASLSCSSSFVLSHSLLASHLYQSLFYLRLQRMAAAKGNILTD